MFVCFGFWVFFFFLARISHSPGFPWTLYSRELPWPPNLPVLTSLVLGSQPCTITIGLLLFVCMYVWCMYVCVCLFNSETVSPSRPCCLGAYCVSQASPTLSRRPPVSASQMWEFRRPCLVTQQFFLKNCIGFCLHVLSVYHLCAVPEEARRWFHIPRDWGYRQL